MSTKNLFLKIVNISSVSVGGLEISDSSLRYLKIEGDKLIKKSLGLPPGLMENGRIKNKEGLTAALGSLHDEIIPSKKKIIHIIASVPAENVYIQSFKMPELSDEELKEAAALNLQMISPLEIEKSYHDWQKVREEELKGQMELLGGFIARDVADEFIDVLSAAGFSVAALEFSGLGIVRVIREIGANVDTTKPHVVLHVTNEGIYLMIMVHSNLHFHYFHSWAAIQGEKKTISYEDLKDSLSGEIQRILNFYSGRWEEQLKNIIVVTDGLSKQLLQIVHGSFPDFSVEELTVGKFTQIPHEWLSVLGTGLRALVPRSQDFELSLMNVGAAEEFYRSQLLNFIKTWRNVALLVVAFVLVIASGANFILRRAAASLEDEIDIRSPETVELTELQNEANYFNQLVTTIKTAEGKRQTVSDIIHKINAISAGNIVINKILFQTTDVPILLNGVAVNEQEALNFKARLDKSEEFEEAILLIDSLVIQPDGSVAFTINFKISLPES